MQHAARPLHYAWIVALVTFATLLVTAGVRATPGVLMVPLEDHFHWSRTTISGAVSLNILLYGLVGPFAAGIMEWAGVKRTMIAALVLVAFGMGLTPWMTESWHLVLLWGVAVGTGSGMAAMVLGATVVTRWFTARRGLMMGIMTASTATGQLIFLPLLAFLAVRFGWPAVSLTVAGVALAMVIPVLLLMRNRPADLGLAPYGETGGPERVVALTGNPILNTLRALRDGMKMRDFWLLAGSFFICGASTNGLIGTHLIPACLDHGIPEVSAANLLAMMGIFDFIGTTLSGWLSDRFSNRLLLALYYGFRGLSLLYLPYAFDLSFYGLSLFALFYGLDWIATVPPTVKLATEAFGKERVGIMFGWIACAHQMGAASATLLAGSLRDGFGSYFAAFFVAGFLCLGASMLVLWIGRGKRQGTLAVPLSQPA